MYAGGWCRCRAYFRLLVRWIFCLAGSAGFLLLIILEGLSSSLVENLLLLLFVSRPGF